MSTSTVTTASSSASSALSANSLVATNNGNNATSSTTSVQASAADITINPLPDTIVSLSPTAFASFSNLPSSLVMKSPSNTEASQVNQMMGDYYAGQLADPATLQQGMDVQVSSNGQPTGSPMNAGELLLSEYAIGNLSNDSYTYGSTNVLAGSSFVFNSYSQQTSDASSTTSGSTGTGATDTRTVAIQGSGYIQLADGDRIAFTAALSVSGSASEFAPATPAASTSASTTASANPSPTASTPSADANNAAPTGGNATDTASTGGVSPLPTVTALSADALTRELDEARNILDLINMVKVYGTEVSSDWNTQINELPQVTSLAESTGVLDVSNINISNSSSNVSATAASTTATSSAAQPAQALLAPQAAPSA